jgi:hypothetical protein
MVQGEAPRSPASARLAAHHIHGLSPRAGAGLSGLDAEYRLVAGCFGKERRRGMSDAPTFDEIFAVMAAASTGNDATVKHYGYAREALREMTVKPESLTTRVREVLDGDY